MIPKRILASHLDITNGLYKLKKKLYTGIILFEKENGYLDGWYVEDGVLTDKKYISPCIPNHIPNKEEIPLARADSLEESPHTRVLIHNGTTDVFLHTVLALEIQENGMSIEEEFFDKGFAECSFSACDKYVYYEQNQRQVFLEFCNTQTVIFDFIVYYYEPLNFRLEFVCQDEKILKFHFGRAISQTDIDDINKVTSFFPYSSYEQILKIPFSKALKINCQRKAWLEKGTLLDQFFEYQEYNQIHQVKNLKHIGPYYLDTFLSFPYLEELTFYINDLRKEEFIKILENINELIQTYEKQYGNRINKVRAEWNRNSETYEL